MSDTLQESALTAWRALYLLYRELPGDTVAVRLLVHATMELLQSMMIGETEHRRDAWEQNFMRARAAELKEIANV